MNKQTEDQLRDFLQDYLSDYEYPVKKDGWSLLEKEIPQAKSTIRKSLWITAISFAAAIVCILCVLSYMKMFHGNKKDLLVIAEENVFPSNTMENIIEEEYTKLVEDVNQPIIQSKTTKKAQTEYIFVSEESVIQDEVVFETTAENNSSETVQDETIKQKVSFNYYENEDDSKIKPEISFHSNKKKLQFSLAGKNVIAMNENISIREIQKNSYFRSFSNSNNIGLNIANQRPTQDKLTNIKYELPINLSLLVRKNLNNRWGVETGVSYTYLASKETWYSIEYDIFAFNNITLHYLGIPAKVSYNFLRHKQLSVYLAGGGMIEKCISGEIRSTNNINGVSTKIPLKVKELQFSFMGNAGIGYRFFSPISVFVEPGFSYYPNDGSSTMTTRKDKPFAFNLQAGLRFDIGK